MGNSIIELTNLVNVVCTTVVEKDGKFLMVEENKPDIRGLWNFLSGKLELGESPLEAAAREAREESGGMDIAITDVLEVGFGNWQDKKGLSIRFVFWGKVQSEGNAEFADDVIRCEWKSPEEIKAMITEGKLRNAYTVHLAEVALQGRRLPLDSVNFYTNSEATLEKIKKEFGG